jgi:cardiolipin synthase
MSIADREVTHRLALRVTLAAQLVAPAACVSLPESTPATDPLAQPALAVSAHSPLDDQQSRKFLDRLGIASSHARMLARHLAIEEAVATTPLVPGNRTRLLRDGPATFRAMFDAIRSARHEIDLEYFILEDVESDGVRLSDLLIQKRDHGVVVNVIYDSFGSSGTPAEFFERLQAAGVNCLEFHPINPLEAESGYSPNNRNHRKILIVDGAVAIVGGINLSTSYESSGSGMSKTPQGTPPEHWRDTDLEIHGPVAEQLRALFLAHWAREAGEPLPGPKALPRVPPQGKEIMRIIASSPEDAVSAYYTTLLSAMRAAEKNVWLTVAYFVPTPEQKAALIAAAQRGVDVRLLVPGESDSRLALAVARTHYAELLAAGIKLYEVRGQILHAKSVTIDGVWSAVGSSNFDHRSLLFNDEVDAIVLGSKTAHELEQMFEQDLQQALPIDPTTWKNRPLLPRIPEFFARLTQSML